MSAEAMDSKDYSARRARWSIERLGRTANNPARNRDWEGRGLSDAEAGTICQVGVGLSVPKLRSAVGVVATR